MVLYCRNITFKELSEVLTQNELEYLNKINGLHEIHITVDYRQIAKLRLYCKYMKIKPIFAVSEKYNSNQLMISKFKNGTSLQSIEKAFSIRDDMKKFGLDVFRTKVEAVINVNGAPKEDEKPLDTKHPSLKGYWEFHIKIPFETSQDIEKLENICKANKAFISYNCFSQEFNPLITLRLYNTSYNQAMELKASLISNIKKGGFKCNYGIRQELSVFDDNELLDEDLFSSDSH